MCMRIVLVFVYCLSRIDAHGVQSLELSVKCMLCTFLLYDG
ncbi:hypothetical protein GLYMA_09G075551v4 [Glycine max]|nr:hypothetical protein GLYMA_09G075551v4 [Glycine max]KAH1042000.1 hypothetical protein GYH30_024353 [Glycine max]